MTDINSLPEFLGFTVYDAETGDPDIRVVIDGQGNFFEDYICLECGKVYVPRGKYIIQLGAGENYRW